LAPASKNSGESRWPFSCSSPISIEATSTVPSSRGSSPPLSVAAYSAKPPRKVATPLWTTAKLRRTHAAVSQRLQDALAAADFPPLAWYELLGAVAEAPERRMKMGDLAESLVITRGGLTKLIDRLIKAGLMERAFCDTDRRVSYATLTLAGIDLLEEMRPVIVAELDRSFTANLSTAQAKDLRRALEQVRASACATT